MAAVADAQADAVVTVADEAADLAVEIAVVTEAETEDLVETDLAQIELSDLLPAATSQSFESDSKL